MVTDDDAQTFFCFPTGDDFEKRSEGDGEEESKGLESRNTTFEGKERLRGSLRQGGVCREYATLMRIALAVGGRAMDLESHLC